MCGRYVQVSKVEVVEKRFNVVTDHPQLFTPDYNTGHGSTGRVITCEDPNKLQFFQFGFSPSWAKKQMYLINARSEGDNNKEDSPTFSGGLGILQKPAFRQAIRQNRCLVIADCFYEGSKLEGLNKPYLVYLRQRRPFAFAGIYNKWINKESGEWINTFAILTTFANDLMIKIGHHRSPVILHESQERTWLNSTAPLSHITPFLHPYPSSLMNAYPISPEVKNLKMNDPSLVQPLGERIYPEHNLIKKTKDHLQGMGSKKRNDPNNSSQPG